MIYPRYQLLHILSSHYSDTLSPAVIQSRTIKPMKTSTYSTQFQLIQERGDLNGLGSFSLTVSHRLDIKS